MLARNIVFSICLSLQLSLAAVQRASADVNPATAATNFTPILINTEATPPRMFRGGEDKWHLTYDLLLTNYTRGASKIKELQILGRKGDGEFRVLKTLSGVELTKAMMQPDLKAKPGGLTPGQIAVVGVNLA